jgi:mRNA interferase RelE/StbE
MSSGASTRCAASVAPEPEPYDLVVAGPAARAIAEVVDLITGPLLTEPTIVGKPLRRELAGIWSARRGTFRVLYRIDDDRREIVVLRIDHRRDVYRSR